jgi:tellurite resistance protein
MEGILGIIILAVIWMGIQAVFSAGARTVTAASRTVMGKGSFAENMDLAFRGMPTLGVRFRDTRMGDDGTGPFAKLIEAKGLFPLTSDTHAAFVVSLFDVTDDEASPVICYLDNFQEADNVVFQTVAELGAITPNQGFPEWVQVAVVFPEMLQPPYGGERQLVAVVRLIDLRSPVPIRHGRCDTDHPGHLWAHALRFSFEFDEKGYEEESEARDEAGALIVKIGMAVAMSDGSLDDAEGAVLRRWVTRVISPFAEGKQGALKSRYNEAMKDAYAEASSGELSLSKLTQRLAEVGETSAHYEAVELCYDIMAADGRADPEEMKTIRAIASVLELDLDELESMRDKRIVGLDASIDSETSAEELLGIGADWPPEKVKSHLREEFQKWNNRLTSLPEGSERDNAQRMIELIADARRRNE